LGRGREQADNVGEPDQRQLDLHILNIFREEVHLQSTFAIIAAEDLAGAITAQLSDRIWYSIQAFLVAAANVSKLLWPSRASQMQVLRRELRRRLAVANPSALEPRSLRDTFEHFDGRLEEWASISNRHNFVDRFVGQLSAIAGLEADDFMRHFDPDTAEISFRQETFRLGPMLAELRTLNEKSGNRF